MKKLAMMLWLLPLFAMKSYAGLYNHYKQTGDKNAGSEYHEKRMGDNNPLTQKAKYESEKKEKEGIDNIDGIVCLTYAAKPIIEKWPQFNRAIPMEVIPCSVDMKLFDPNNIDPKLKLNLKNKLGISEKDFIISYLGSIGGWYLTNEMMEFFKLFSLKIPSAKLLFISPHQHEVIFEAAAKAGISKDKIIVTNARRHEVPLLLSLSIFSVFFIKSCYSKSPLRLHNTGK